MKPISFAHIAGIIFAIVAVAHAARIAFGWPLMVNTWIIPMWVSWLGLIIAAVLAGWGLGFRWKFDNKQQRRRA